MQDLPLGRIAALVSEFAMKDLPLGKTLMMMKLSSKFYSFTFRSNIPTDEVAP